MGLSTRKNKGFGVVYVDVCHINVEKNKKEKIERSPLTHFLPKDQIATYRDKFNSAVARHQKYPFLITLAILFQHKIPTYQNLIL